MSFAIIITIIKDGKTKLKGAIIPYKIPPAFIPANVAIFIPIGPGVDSLTAIIVRSSSCVKYPKLSPIFAKNGIVASPPPIEKSPVLKNS